MAFLLGQYDEVQQAGRRLLAGSHRRDGAAEVTWLMAYSLLRAGHPAEAIDALKIAVTRPDVNEVWSARLRALQALMLSMTRRLDEAAEAAARALADAERTADPFATGYVLYAQSSASFLGRDLAGALSRIDQALAVIGDSDQATDLRLMLLANRVAALGLLTATTRPSPRPGRRWSSPSGRGHPGWPCSAARWPTSISKPAAGMTRWPSSNRRSTRTWEPVSPRARALRPDSRLPG